MRKRCGIFLLALSCFALASEPVSVSDFRRQLQNLSEKASAVEDHPEQAAKLVTEIPDQIAVKTSTGQISVNLRHLKDDLARFSAAGTDAKPQDFQKIQTYISSLQSEADAYERRPADPSSREKLNQILSRHEFRRVHTASAGDTLLSKIYRWVAHLFDRIHLNRKASFGLLQGIVYALLGGALVLLLLWTMNRLRRREEELPAKEIIPFAPSARSWRAWLADARSSAAIRDWRNAIHLAYWAGISFLESGGAWKPNRARTPREYLRLLSTRNPHHPPLLAITRKFEVVWYGHREAGEQDFQEALAHLEKLGCR